MSRTLTITERRRVFYRGETIAIHTTAAGAIAATLGPLEASAPGGTLRIDTSSLKCGRYDLRVVQGESECRETVELVKRRAADRMTVWLWPHQAYEDAVKPCDERVDEMLAFWTRCGFNNFGINRDVDDNARRYMDHVMRYGGTVCLKPCGGLATRDFDEPLEGDMVFNGIEPSHYEHGKLANPFHVEVAAKHERLVAQLMAAVRDYPQVATAFFNTELVDAVRISVNEAGLRMMREHLGTTELPTGEPTYIASGVVDDDEPRLAADRYRYKLGDGLVAANRRTADAIHRVRPDVLTIHDPFRQHGYLDTFDGIDVVSTWTYTNPDPKMMLFTETLRRACVTREQTFLSTVTLLNYPGELDPSDQWMMMGPGRIAVTTWINLSRCPRMVGYYFSSVFEPFGALENDLTTKVASRPDYEMPQASFDMLERLSREVFEPLGALVGKLRTKPRRMAVLSANASPLYSKTQPLPGFYVNMQPYHFYTVLAMAQLPADVLLEESITRRGLDDYDVLVLPRCEVLPQSVVREIENFRRRGGLVIADQFLGPDLADMTFDFDFDYRRNVTATAIAKGRIPDRWNDQVDPTKAKFVETEGVTAEDDQRMMESYAAKLRDGLDDRIERAVDCDSPRALTNLCEAEDATYLFVINDHRTYDDRTGKYKAVLGKVEPQTVNIDMPGAACAYDLIDHKPLDVRAGSFAVPLDDLGGKLIALYAQPLRTLMIDAPKQIERGSSSSLKILMPEADTGLQPLTITITDATGHETEYGGHHLARRGVLVLPMNIALNDEPGEWAVHVRDLTAGLEANATLTVL